LQLKDLIARAETLPKAERISVAGPLDVEITGITAEAPYVERGFLYAAIPGGFKSGPERVPEAVAAGAAALLLPERGDIAVPPGMAVLRSANLRRAMAFLSAAFAGVQPQTVVAVTGTSGKTSTTVFVRQLWTALGHRAASIGTIGLFSPNWNCDVAITTPHPFDLHPALAFLVEDGVDHLALEATSQGLDQHRLDALSVSAAAFTNLSRDHLNYHGGMAEYFAAKQRLFADLLPPGAPAVVNADSDVAETIIAIARRRGHRLIRTGRDDAEIRLVERETVEGGQALTLDVFGRRESVIFPLSGPFQVENLLVALGLVIGTGGDIAQSLAAIANLSGVRGRLESVGTSSAGGSVYIDYAHKPAALEAVLTSLRAHTRGRLIVVFGCGGETDPGKRPLMGAVATQLADRVVITDDNPRSEDPARIRAEIRATAPDAVEIGDRHEAIRAAIAMLQSGDVLVIAGKGHETSQIAAGVHQPFDDAAVARALLAEILSG
jgi:UDP-N-acetylmuramoyl-L-alanyl-D-glutamate--2,6-diaminopimelate ligase